MAKSTTTDSGKKLVDLLMKNSKSKFTSRIDKSNYFNEEKELVTTDILLLNTALSGSLDGGLGNGVTAIAGESKRFKTMYGLYMVSAFLKKYKEGICIFYDTEGGASRDYFESFGIDLSRVIWVPISTVEELKTEVVNQLESLKQIDDPTNKVIIFIDSVGNLASLKETEDALEGSNKADMTRAKQLKSFYRIVTLPTKLLNIPMVVINHVYKTMAFISEDVMSGGTGGTLAADTIIFINKRQIKDSEKDLEGFTFELKINKSRFVREGSKFPINVYFNEGIAKYSGLDELAEDLGVITTGKNGKSKTLIFDKMEIPEKENDRNEEFWSFVVDNSDLNERIKNKYKICSPKIESDTVTDE